MIVPPEWWTAAREPDDSFGRRLARLAGIAPVFTVDGVQYRERRAEPLRRALSERGRGFKEYDVQFASGERMRIRAARDRFYPDLIALRMPPLGRLIEQLVRPGMRVALLDAGTGQAGAWAALCAGTAGAVVALERDGESVRFARRRYPASNISYEIGDLNELRGELDGAFSGVIALRAAERAPDAWRVVGPGGWLLTGDEGASALRKAIPGAGPLGSAVERPAPALRLVLFRRPGEGPASSPGTGPA